MNQRHLRTVVDSLGYDFRQFEIEHFVHYVEQQRQRAIFCLPYNFHAGLTGLWLPAETADYIFYALHTPLVHQIHIQLHETAHLLLNHRCIYVKMVLPAEIIAMFGLTVDLAVGGAAASCLARQEQEAEMFAYLIQQRIVAARRLAEFRPDTSSIHGLDRFTDTLGWLE